MTTTTKMKTPAIFFIIIITAATFLMACEANKHISVRVFDSKTRKPLDSVLVQVNAGKNGDYHKSTTQGLTNATGQFDAYLMIGCSFGCYDIYTEYSKKGYEDKKDFNITEGTVLLNPK
jgi:hypothetical protein